MRQIVILIILFLIMSALQFLQLGGESDLNPKSMASFGFILLAGYVLGENATRWRLPRISGYIVTGLLCGPHLIKLLTQGVVEDLRLIDDLAVGLIALTAGGELRLSALQQGRKSIAYMAPLLVLVIFTVISVCVAVARPLVPFLADQSWFYVIGVALMFGVLCAASSPAATIAVINETGAQGVVTERVLGVTIVKDVAVILTLALMMPVTQLLTSPGAGFEMGFLFQVLGRIILSLVVGVLLGIITALYIKYMNAEMMLFVVGLIYVGAAFGRWLHLEVLLMFVVTGFIVENFTEQGDHLIDVIERASLPVYVVFFAIAGAGIDVPALQASWEIALILVGARLLATYLAAYVSAKQAGDPISVGRYAWLGFIPQAAVTLGLATIVEQTFPDWGDDFRSIMLAVIAINVLIGPIAFKLALDRAGETEEMRERTLILAEAPTRG